MTSGNFKKKPFYTSTEGFPGSIIDNIAEGFERGIRAEFIRLLDDAKDSCGELRSHLYRAFDRRYIDDEIESLKQKISFTSGLIQNLISYLQKTELNGVRKKQLAANA